MPTNDEIKANLKAAYATAAEGWERWDDTNVACFQPITDRLCRAIGAAPGHHVLDLASGTGIPALDVAKRVLPGGRVTATDLSPPMLAALDRKLRRLGINNVELCEMDAENLRFPDGSFDGVTFASALMFCPDAVRALSEIRRVLKPGGRFAAAVWDLPAKNGFLTVLFGALAQVLPSPPPDPNAPGPFRFAAPGALETVVRAAGFSEFSVESQPFVLDVSPSDYLPFMTDMAAGLKAKLAALPAAEHARLSALVQQGCQPFLDGERLKLPAAQLVVSGVKS